MEIIKSVFTEFSRIARTISSRNQVDVVLSQRNGSSYTDGLRIFLDPLISFYKEDDFLMANGTLDHETAHLRYTKFSDENFEKRKRSGKLTSESKENLQIAKLKKKILRPIENEKFLKSSEEQMACIQHFEDIRVNRLMNKDFPGCGDNIEAMEKLCLDMHLQNFDDEKKIFNYSNLNRTMLALRVINGLSKKQKKEFNDYFKEYFSKDKFVVSFLTDVYYKLNLQERIGGLGNTEDTINFSYLFESLFRKYEQKFQKEQKEQKQKEQKQNKKSTKQKEDQDENENSKRTETSDEDSEESGEESDSGTEETDEENFGEGDGDNSEESEESDSGDGSETERRVPGEQGEDQDESESSEDGDEERDEEDQENAESGSTKAGGETDDEKDSEESNKESESNQKDEESKSEEITKETLKGLLGKLSKDKKLSKLDQEVTEPVDPKEFLENKEEERTEKFLKDNSSNIFSPISKEVLDDDKMFDIEKIVLSGIDEIDRGRSGKADLKNIEDSKRDYETIKEYVNLETKKIVNGFLQKFYSKTLDFQYQSEEPNNPFDLHEVAKQINYTDYKSLFPYIKTMEGEKRNIAVTIVVDISGSMRTKIEDAIRAVVMLVEALDKVNIKSEVLAHNSRNIFSLFGTEYGRTESTNLYVIKSFNSNKNYLISNIYNLCGSANADGAALEYSSQRLISQEAERKVLFYIADGLPTGYSSTESGENHMKYLVEELKKFKVEFYAIGLGVQMSEIYGDKISFELEKGENISSGLSKIVTGKI